MGFGDIISALARNAPGVIAKGLAGKTAREQYDTAQAFLRQKTALEAEARRQALLQAARQFQERQALAERTQQSTETYRQNALRQAWDLAHQRLAQPTRGVVVATEGGQEIVDPTKIGQKFGPRPVQPQVTVAAGPGGELYRVPRSGGEATPVTVAGGQSLVKQDTGREKAIRENRASLGSVQAAIQQVDANPKAFGLKNLLPEMITQRVNPEGVLARQAVADIASLKIHDRSGAAVTASEFPRLRPFIPKVDDTSAKVRANLVKFAEEYQRVLDELEQGYTIDQVRGGAPSGAPTPEGEQPEPEDTERQAALDAIRRGADAAKVAARYKQRTGKDLNP